MQTLEIDQNFLHFIELLDKKEAGVPLIHWQESLDFLTVFIGEGDCRRYFLAGIICSCTDIIYKMFPQKGEDPFAGFQIWGGIQAFLRQHHMKLMGEERYKEFVVRHNRERHSYHASELFDLWLARYPAREPERVARVREALKRQNPTIHIPL